jgi:hypothetical protein
MSATCTVNLTLRDLAIQTFGEKYKLWRASLSNFLQSFVTSCRLGPNILFSTPLSNILNPCSSFATVKRGTEFQQSHTTICFADGCFPNVVTYEQLPTVAVYFDRWWKSFVFPVRHVSCPAPNIIQKSILVKRAERYVSLGILWQVQISTIINDDTYNVI